MKVRIRVFNLRGFLFVSNRYLELLVKGKTQIKCMAEVFLAVRLCGPGCKPIQGGLVASIFSGERCSPFTLVFCFAQ